MFQVYHQAMRDKPGEDPNLGSKLITIYIELFTSELVVTVYVYVYILYVLHQRGCIIYSLTYVHFVKLLSD